MQKNNNKNLHNISSRRIIHIVIIYLLFLVFLVLAIPTVSAGGQDATFDSVHIKAVPPIQGIGGEVHVEAEADFYGGCCYHLYARDVKAELKVPENIHILSQPPKIIPEVDAVPGGKATSVRFHWVLAGDQPGLYDLEVVIGTSNCGTESAICQVSIVKGVSISSPNLHPSVPSVKEAITFLVDVRSGNELVSIDRTSLFIWRTNKDYSEEQLKAEKDKLFEQVNSGTETDENINNTNNAMASNETASTENNVQYKLLSHGAEYIMTPVQFTDTWRLRLNEFKNEEKIYYWFNVETSDGENITSYVYRKNIDDLEKKYQQVDFIIWSTFFIITIGVIIILGISWSIFGRVIRNIGKSSIFVLGSSTYTKPSEGTRTNISSISLSLERVRFLLFILCFFIAIILITLSIYLGLIDDLITVTGG